MSRKLQKYTIHMPLVMEDAIGYIYGDKIYQKGKCAYVIYPDTMVPDQCANRATCGPDHLYCGLHAKVVLRQLRERK